ANPGPDRRAKQREETGEQEQRSPGWIRNEHGSDEERRRDQEWPETASCPVGDETERQFEGQENRGGQDLLSEAGHDPKTSKRQATLQPRATPRKQGGTLMCLHARRGAIGRGIAF